MEVREYIRNQINKIDSELVSLLDHDSIMLLKTRKEIYSIFLSLLQINLKINLEMKISDNLDTSKNSVVMESYGFKLDSERMFWEYKISDETRIFIKCKGRNLDSTFADNILYIETGYREIIEIPNVISQMVKDNMLV